MCQLAGGFSWQDLRLQAAAEDAPPPLSRQNFQDSILRASSSARLKVTAWETAEMQQNNLWKEGVLDYCSCVSALGCSNQ